MKALFLSLLIFTIGRVHAQNQESFNVDTLFQQAQKKAFSNKREEARELLRILLKNNPNYAEAQVLLARTYAWDGEYDKARFELQTVLEETPKDEEALNLIVDIATWNKEYDIGLIAVNKALVHFPTSADLLFKKARLCYALQYHQEAILTINTLTSLYPILPEWAKLKNTILEMLLYFEASLSGGVDKFDQRFGPAYYSSAQLSIKNSWGVTVLRTNYSNRFGRQGFQPEVEWYPKVSKKTYGYVNYGYSQSALFPSHRMGAELYTMLLKKLEGSLGLRYFDFGSLNQVWIYTSSISWYQRKYLITLRPSLIYNQGITTYATSLAIRKYFNDEHSYLALTMNTGLLPDERRLQSGVGVNPDRSYTLKSRGVSLALYKTLSHHFAVRLSYDLTQREMAFNSNEYIRINTGQIALYKKF